MTVGPEMGTFINAFLNDTRYCLDFYGTHMLNRMGLLFGLDEKPLYCLPKWHWLHLRKVAINVNPQKDDKSLQLNLTTEPAIFIFTQQRLTKPKLIMEL